MLRMAYCWVSQGALMVTAKRPTLKQVPLTHLNHDTANRMWWAVRNHLGYKGENNTHGLYVLRHTVASRLVSLKGFNAHKLMAFMGHTDIKSSLHYVHLNVDDIRDGVGVGA
ncbi:site-specific recombinase, phage integrase family [Campylobacter concisus]|uniref:Site-specific recombinase, phage integrase family n=1 Tax=Campylobacter concisus TaxID=199 RepID=A0A0M5MIN0_9BACT|nr:site-specific recombinase, phage integrase family [Campylobacter concisus]